MYATPAPPVSTLSNTVPATSASPSRSGRPRGLSYWRSHAQAHTDQVGSASSNSTSRHGEGSRPQQLLNTSTSSAQTATRAPGSRPRDAQRMLRAHRSEAEVPRNRSPGGRTDGNTEDRSSSTHFPTLGSTSLAHGTSNDALRLAGSEDAQTVTRQRAATAHSNSYAPFGYMPPLPSSTQPASEVTASSDAAAASVNVLQPSTSAPVATTMTRSSSRNQLPSIRFVCHQDLRGARPSLSFGTLSRTLPHSDAKIRVGRYSERDNAPELPPSIPSDAPIGFKSKVVSRRHCEFWYQNNQWYIKDVKSSSGTFLNHIRLSQPGVESRPWPMNDGDIVQLGIDFKGGEEMIFRCVKIRIECNRSWQKALNKFNKSTHKHLRNLAKKGAPLGIDSIKEGDTASMHSTECSICLMSIAPCQSLFVAPCSHTWHYKCIRPVINGPSWPQFQCPNCRAYADLEADIDEPSDYEEWEDEELFRNTANTGLVENGHQQDLDEEEPTFLDDRSDPSPDCGSEEGEMLSGLAGVSLQDMADQPEATASHNLTNGRLSHTANQSDDSDAPLYGANNEHNIQEDEEDQDVTQLTAMTPSNSVLDPSIPETASGEGPITPRNDAGPFVLDGGGSQRPSAAEDVNCLNRTAAA